MNLFLYAQFEVHKHVLIFTCRSILRGVTDVKIYGVVYQNRSHGIKTHPFPPYYSR